MSTVVFGINHRTASVDLLERVTLADDSLGKAITNLVSRSNVREAAILSTCNRTEVYAIAERFHGAFDDIRDFLCELAGMSAAELSPHLYSRVDDEAVRHLFSVAAGLDSAVIGETEILGQVRGAWDVGRIEGGVKASLNLLFRHAVETGKRVRTETGISRGTASVSHAAVEMANTTLPGGLAGRRTVVIGAGEMGEGIAVALAAAGAGEVRVLNRTAERAHELAARVGGTVVAWDQLRSSIASADVVLSSTGSPTPLIDTELVTAARGTSTSPLLFVDVAVPRDVASDVAHLPGVRVLNLDDLRDWAAVGLQRREGETIAARAIVADEVDRYIVDATSRQAAPLVAQIHELGEQIRQSELERVAHRLDSLTDEQRNAVDAVTKGIVAKLLHTASVRLKHDVGTPRGERNAAAARDLFDLD